MDGEMFELGRDETPYRLFSREHVGQISAGGRELLVVESQGLVRLAREAMSDVSFKLRPAHNCKVAEILRDPMASANDKLTARAMLENAVIAAEGKLPFCQDTGTAIVVAHKGHLVLTDGDDARALSLGIERAYREENLRYSQVVPLGMYEERNFGNNLPAQIDIYATAGDEYRFLFLAKGGGSANKSMLFQMTRAILNPRDLPAFLIARMAELGTAACPPYHLAVVVGGTSAEATMKATKLASAGYYDSLPKSGSPAGRAFRDLELEEQLLEASRALGFGAQFGGRHFCHDVRVIRLARHGASCPIGIGVSCSADRNVKAKITRDGIFIEELDRDPGRWLIDQSDEARAPKVPIDLSRPLDEVRRKLSRYPVGTALALTGRLVVARDIAHARLKERLDRGEGLPDYFTRHPIYYAGPAKTPPGMAAGSFGPTTAARMDPYVEAFQAAGASLVMIAKGNRSAAVVDACRRYGGFYLGSIGGPGAALAQKHIRHLEVLDYEELGMEAVFAIDVVDFPAFIVIDDKGADLFAAMRA